MVIPLETQEKAKEIILAGLRAQSHGSVIFCDIQATVRLNAEDEEILFVSVIYEGPYSDLDTRQRIALHGEIEPQLLEIGILHVPPVSYVPKVEYDQMLSETAATRPWRQRG